MARKKMARKKTNNAAPLPGWVWLTTGLMIGLFVAFLVHLKENYPALSLGNTQQTAKTTDTRAVRKTSNGPPPTKTRFDFYTILPEMEIAVPDDEIDAASNNASVPALQQPGRYIIQAGSFRKLEQADRMKANLALLGIQAYIESVTINNKDTFHRVRIGPYSELNKLNHDRKLLRRNKVDILLLKLKT